MIPKIERDFVAADLAAVEALLAQMTDEDVLSTMSLEARRDELRQALASLAASPESAASAALFFRGRPVVGNRGIEAEFGTEATHDYQDIVNKVFAYRQSGRLGQRGTVPGKDLSKLYITQTLRGSFGFRLEELAPQAELLGSPLKDAVDETARLMTAFGEPDDDIFLNAVSNVDARVLEAVRSFFDLIRQNNVTFRLVSSAIDRSFDVPTVVRAADRARVTTLTEEPLVFEGELGGVLPERRLFEYRTGTDRATIIGGISPELPDEEVATMNQQWVGKPSRATVIIKQVIRGGNVSRETFSMTRIDARAE
jgi:hypothetical protein